MIRRVTLFATLFAVLLLMLMMRLLFSTITAPSTPAYEEPIPPPRPIAMEGLFAQLAAQLSLEAESLTLYLEEASLDRMDPTIEINGPLRIRTAHGERLVGEGAIYEPQERVLTIVGTPERPILIETPTLYLEGYQLKAYLTPELSLRSINMRHEIKLTNKEPIGKQEPGMVVRADSLDYDPEQALITLRAKGEQRVRCLNQANHQKIEAECFVYDLNRATIQAKGQVHVAIEEEDLRQLLPTDE